VSAVHAQIPSYFTRAPMEAMRTIYIRNTFINDFDAEEFGGAKGHHSYPPSPRDQGPSVKHLTFLEELQKPPLYHGHGGAPVQAGEEKFSSDEAPTSSEKPASSQKKRRKAKNRACKGKRDRYLRFVMRVCSEVYEDPISFNLNRVELPPSLTSNPRKYQVFRAQIQSYQRQLLDGENFYTHSKNLARDEAIYQLGKLC